MPSKGSGLVRLCVNGKRGTVCDSDSWSFNEARVACESAGYSPNGIYTCIIVCDGISV